MVDLLMTWRLNLFMPRWLNLDVSLLQEWWIRWSARPAQSEDHHLSVKKSPQQLQQDLRDHVRFLFRGMARGWTLLLDCGYLTHSTRTRSTTRKILICPMLSRIDL